MPAASARRVVVGRPLRPEPSGEVGFGGPVRAVLVNGRVAEVAPWREPDEPGAFLGGPTSFLAPALSDPHTHLLATASSRTGWDLAEDPPRTLRDLLDRLRAFAQADPSDGWLHVRGFDEHLLAEGRAPNRAELDAVVGPRPTRVRHATLHASLLSTAALELLPRGIQPQSPTQALVVGQDEALRSIAARGNPEAVREGLARVGVELARFGITCVDDTSASNDAARVAVMANAVEAGALPQRVRVWLRDASEADASRAAAGPWVEIAGVKLLPTRAEQTRSEEFTAAVARARAAGLPIAVHAVDPDVIDGATEALVAAPQRRGGSDAPDRIEHCSLCPPYLVERVASAGLAVVTQPGFLVARGAKYEREVEPPLWPWLYPVRSLREAGIPVAFSSDTPVIAPDPRLGFVGALERASETGVAFGRGEAIDAAQALAAYTADARRVRGDVPDDRWLAPGAPADLVLLADSDVRSWSPTATVYRGDVLWSEAA